MSNKVFIAKVRSFFEQTSYLHESAPLYPQRCCEDHSAANAASRVDQRFHLAGSGCFIPRCWLRGIVYSRVVSTGVSISACSEREVAELCHLILTFL